MRDRLGRVIYVGKARALNKRVRSYFQAARFSQMEPKTRALVEMAADIEIFEVKNEAESFLLEGKLIKQYKPKYNIAFRDDKRFLLVKLTQDPFPRFVLTRLQKPDGCRYYGPFSNSTALRNTLEYIRKHFHIRSCHPSEPGDKDYKHCMNDILKHCSAPCVNRITRDEYDRWIERASDFLEGRDEEALKNIENDMQKAAKRHDFERAASLRDTLFDLRVTVNQSARKFARDIPRQCNPETELKSLSEALQLSKVPSLIEGFDISHIHGQHTVGSMVQFVNGKPMKSNYRHFTIRGPKLRGAVTDGDQNQHLAPETYSVPARAINDDFASIREIVGRRYRRLQDEGKSLPNLVLIDGGRGQLNSALIALNDVGVLKSASIQVIGLAKENEEIYHPDKKEPIILSHSSPALHLLQRIRDESHRFANTLHHGWRKKQIRESILDEISGLGIQRKSALLKKFGSLERLRKASFDEITGVEGFGEKSAELVWKHLHPEGQQSIDHSP